MGVFLDKCTNIGIKFHLLKYRIPALAAHSQRAAVGQHTLDRVGYANNLVFLFWYIKNLELVLDLSSTAFKRYHLQSFTKYLQQALAFM